MRLIYTKPFWLLQYSKKCNDWLGGDEEMHRWTIMQPFEIYVPFQTFNDYTTYTLFSAKLQRFGMALSFQLKVSFFKWTWMHHIQNIKILHAEL